MDYRIAEGILKPNNERDGPSRQLREEIQGRPILMEDFSVVLLESARRESRLRQVQLS